MVNSVEFLEDIKKKKIEYISTDEYYTPPAVYDVIVEYCIKNYGINKKDIIRPFIPNGDYKKINYKNKVVIDNPPFSIEKEIVEFYSHNDVKFFLFCQGLNTLQYFQNSNDSTNCCIITKTSIVYDNQKSVNTNFITNLEEGGIRLDKDLTELLKSYCDRAVDKNPIFPIEWINSARLLKYSSKINYKINAKDLYYYPKLKCYGKGFGGCCLVNPNEINNIIQMYNEIVEEKRVKLHPYEEKIINMLKENKNNGNYKECKIKL